MTFEDARKSWRSEVGQRVSATELQQLVLAAQQRYGELERKLHWRDVREILLGMLVVAGFAAGWPMYRSSLVASLVVAVIMVSAPIIMFVQISASKPASTPFTAAVLEFSRQKLAWLDRQISLLQTMVWWSVAPLFTGCMLVFWGLTPGKWLPFCILTLFAISVSAVVVFWNRRSVRIQLMPMRQELAALIETLEPTG